MVKHIVVYTLKEGVDKDAAVELIASKLHKDFPEAWASTEQWDKEWANDRQWS